MFYETTIESGRVDTCRSRVYIRPANVSLRHLALSGSIFPSLPADKLFPAVYQEFTTYAYNSRSLRVIERTFVR